MVRTCSHAQNDQKSLKPLRIAIFTISADFGVSQCDESCTLKFLRIRILVKPCHNDTLEKNYDHTIFDARTMFVQSLHVRDVNILVIRDFLCILHNILRYL